MATMGTVATCYVNFNEATVSGNTYTFDYSVYNSVKAATSCFILNNGTVVSTPCIVTRRDSGTYVLTYSSTSFYVTASNPTALTSVDPD